MSFHIVVDSCCDLTEEMKKDSRITVAPLVLRVGEENIIDDESFDQAYFLKRVSECPTCPKSACPSPEYYRERFEGPAERFYGVTLSAELSGSFNSAVLGKDLYQEEQPEKQIYIFNSRSAACGETLIALKILECEEKGMSFEEVVQTVEDYIAGQHTYFVLETLEMLRKNGRLSLVKSFVATALKIKPVMGATQYGEIIQLDQVRGMNKALSRMIDILVKEAVNPEEKLVAITHCNCPERAEKVKQSILERMKVKDVVVVDAAGVSSLYAADGGIVVAF